MFFWKSSVGLPFCNRYQRKRSYKKLCEASAYAEFMERLQNMFLVPVPKRYAGRKSSMYPFMSYPDCKTVMLPIDELYRLTASNGMASGNTINEAAVQGMSEILERFSEMEIVKNRLTPPPVPDEVLDRYPRIRKMIEQTKAVKGLDIRILDCSLGKGLPVLCAAITDQLHGTVGMTFGAHPEMGIALERLFTETVQGRNLKDASMAGSIEFSSGEMLLKENTFQMLKSGDGIYPASLLEDNPGWTFKEWKDVSSFDSKALFDYMVSVLLSISPAVYLADVSFLGFPTVYVYAAGVSEVTDPDYALEKARLKLNSAKAWKALSDIDDKDVKRLLKFSEYSSKYGESDINYVTSVPYVGCKIGGNYELELFNAACYWRLGKGEKAAAVLKSVLSEGNFIRQTDMLFTRGVYLLITGLNEGREAEDVKAVMDQLLPKAVSDLVFHIWENPNDVIKMMYPDCTEKCEKCNAPCAELELENLYETLLNKRTEYGNRIIDINC